MKTDQDDEDTLDCTLNAATNSTKHGSPELAPLAPRETFEPNTFRERLKAAMGPRGYEQCLRRSVQTIILYETSRSIADRLPSLRPFQRKIAFLEQAKTILDEHTDLLPYQKEEVMWRTMTSREQMTADIAYKRMKVIEKELEKLATAMADFRKPGLTHTQVCDSYVQRMFEGFSGNKGKKCPMGWEHAHNHIILCYRMYYRGTALDPTFPPPIPPPKEIVVPAEKETVADGVKPHYISIPNEGSALSPAQEAATAVQAAQAAPAPAPPAQVAPAQVPIPYPALYPVPAMTLQRPPSAAPVTLHAAPPQVQAQTTPAAGASQAQPQQPVSQTSTSKDSNRRQILQEVREHLELLKEFEGVIEEEELNKRKRELFLAMPSAPPPAKGARRMRLDA